MTPYKPHLFNVHLLVIGTVQIQSKIWVPSTSQVRGKKLDTVFIESKSMAESANVIGGSGQWQGAFLY